MTYRERRLAKAERLRGWAAKRESAASATLATDREKYRGDWAFNTQPGHIPERARVIARTDRALESLDKAGKMERRAAGIEAQLDRTIYDDDPDAIEALTAKAESLERKRDHMKAVNKAYKAGNGPALEALGTNLDILRSRLTREGISSWCRVPYPAYELTNLGATIRNARKRIQDIRIIREAQAATDAAGGFLLTRFPNGWCRVQFSEKPERAIIQALRDAGFTWGGGRWSGMTENLPQSVLDIALDLPREHAIDCEPEGNCECEP